MHLLLDMTANLDTLELRNKNTWYWYSADKIELDHKQMWSPKFINRKSHNHLPGLLITLFCFMEKWSCKIKSGPLDECKFVVATSPPSISAKLVPLTWEITPQMFDRVRESQLATLGMMGQKTEKVIYPNLKTKRVISEM